MTKREKTLTELQGVQVGHATDRDHLTGCTVVLFESFFPCTCEGRGGVTASFFSDGIAPTKCLPTLNALFIAGGSVAGLTVSAGIYDYLRKEGHGQLWEAEGKPGARVPRIAGAVVADRGIFYEAINPHLGYMACENAVSGNVQMGNVGAGTGTVVGKFCFTRDQKPLFCKSGVGGAFCHLPGNLKVAALTVVNALGNVHDRAGQVVAGNRHPDHPDGNHFIDFMDLINGGIVPNSPEDLTQQEGPQAGATTVSIFGTNADLGHEQLFRVTQMAQAGIARAIRPVYTSLDGDTVFGFSTGEVEIPSERPMRYNLGHSQLTPGWQDFYVDMLGAVAAEVVFESILSAVRTDDNYVDDKRFGGTIPPGKYSE
ncbi:MAG: hypothetical protein GY835_09635 [bacterium]|nr:hypothetical protein [bacterium]